MQREAKGHNYYQIEFTASNSRYTRHQLAVVAANNGGCGTGWAALGIAGCGWSGGRSHGVHAR